MSDTASKTRPIVRAEWIENRGRFWSEDTDRWALVRARDCWAGRAPSMAVRLSDGTRIAGELPPWFCQQRAFRWVMEGR